MIRKPIWYLGEKENEAKNEWYEDNRDEKGETVKPDDTAEEINRKTGNKPKNDVYRKSDRAESSDADEPYETNKDLEPYETDDSSKAARKDETEPDKKPAGLKYRSKDMH
ncbi:hypothetical protein SAMN05421823_101294 [Catalinimonas alkaloidigena]|uniref:Uncharacterized protein n=1 Tax=Catalinimonas alkaloidigena TaxID=1075417 RepID=A0A1G8X7W6_9BACT|nr:hypothetical protein [Catalinimonas alkaloidigena]SDJ86779.1 hypothetical protein SAMN05421823_101294 [Catalinimonas alkaloidigena]